MPFFIIQGNPIERERMYQTDILKETNIQTLDNIAVRPIPKPTVNLPVSTCTCTQVIVDGLVICLCYSV